MSEVNTHALVLCLEVTRIQFFHDKTGDLWAWKQEWQLRQMQQFEGSGLIGDIGMCVIRDPGYCGLETVDGAMEQSVSKGFQSKSTLGLFFDERGKGNESPGIEAVRSWHMGGIA